MYSIRTSLTEEAISANEAVKAYKGRVYADSYG